MCPSKVIPIPEGVTPGWKVSLADGTILQNVKKVIIENPKYGALTYGANPSGIYDTWAFHEAGGGGSVIVPFALIMGVLWIGVVLQKRDFQSDEPVLNVPRGFLDPGEDHFKTAAREATEEFVAGERVFILPGEPGNPNSTFFETWDKLPSGEPEGVRFYALEIKWYELIQKGGEDVYEIITDVLKATEGDKVAEGILKCQFIPWTEAALLGDQFSNSAVARLTAFLNEMLSPMQISAYKKSLFERLGKRFDDLLKEILQDD